MMSITKAGTRGRVGSNSFFDPSSTCLKNKGFNIYMRLRRIMRKRPTTFLSVEGFKDTVANRVLASLHGE